MTKCRECGNEVSTKAESCPKCGAVMKKRMGCLGYLAAGFLILLILSAINFTLNSTLLKEPSSTSESGNKDKFNAKQTKSDTTNLDILKQLQSALIIDRTWDENVGGYCCSYALVTWENKTTRTFRSVTIQAVAYDPSERKINENQRSFFAHERGPIVPGFKGTLKIPVELGHAQFAKMGCSIISIN